MLKKTETKYLDGKEYKKTFYLFTDEESHDLFERRRDDLDEEMKKLKILNYAYWQPSPWTKGKHKNAKSIKGDGHFYYVGKTEKHTFFTLYDPV